MILLAVCWYLRYGLSYRDLEELLAERGIEVDHVTLYRWVQRFDPEPTQAACPRRHCVGDQWFTGATYVKATEAWRYVYRATDQHGQVIDELIPAAFHNTGQYENNRCECDHGRRSVKATVRPRPPCPPTPLVGGLGEDLGLDECRER